MSPLLGIHTVLGILVSIIFKLNRLITIAGVYVTNPWTIIPIYSLGTWSGVKLLGSKVFISDIDWKTLNALNILDELKGLLLPFIVGTFFLGTLLSVLSYMIIRLLLKRKYHV